VLVRVLEREVFAHLDRKVMPMDILSLLRLGPNGGLALRKIEVGTANVIVSRPSSQTRCNFQRPVRKTNVLAIANVEKAIGIAMKTPVAPARQ
jgi:hypothetical protein